jgi:uncharacterized protein with gpF-like domain
VLINVTNDNLFQEYLDQEEQRLYMALWPVLTAGVRIQVNMNAIRAQDYVTARGEKALYIEYHRIHRDQFNAVSDQVAKAAGVSDFLAEQTRYLLAQASRKITQISETLRQHITDLMLAGVAEGKSNNQIAREILQRAPEIGKSRAATIARTEAHNSALDAIDATVKYKALVVKRKTWWTAQDARVRQSHVDVHGETVDFDQPFDVGGVPMMRPGDQSLGAGAEEVVNCRCAVLYSTAAPGE